MTSIELWLVNLTALTFLCSMTLYMIQMSF